MNPELLQAYYWLSSAIAQAFAALIALSGVFYIYRIGALQKKITEVLNYLKWLISGSTSKDYWLKIHQYTEKKVIELANVRLNEQAFSKQKDETSAHLQEYESINKLKRGLKTVTVGPLMCSAITMFFGVIALLIGSKINSDDWRFAIMISESILAAVALGWTAYVVIRMLKEPEEPQEQSS